MPMLKNEILLTSLEIVDLLSYVNRFVDLTSQKVRHSVRNVDDLSNHLQA